MTTLKTHILVILDESGSMGSKTLDVIGGYNRFLEEQRALPDPADVTLIKFNTNKSVVYAARPIADAPEIGRNDYVPGGMTALYDAVAEGVRLGDQHPSDRVLCVVITDGEENASRETSSSQIAEIIAAREATGNWTFAYLGVSPEQWAARTGTSTANMMAYDANQLTEQLAIVSERTMSYRVSDRRATTSFIQPEAANPVTDAAKTLGSRGGQKGGPARAAKLTPEQRATIARNASRVRWDKVSKKGE